MPNCAASRARPAPDQSLPWPLYRPREPQSQCGAVCCSLKTHARSLLLSLSRSLALSLSLSRSEAQNCTDRMKLLVLAAALLAVASAATISLEDLEFHAWKLKFEKIYGSSEEEAQRKLTWLSNRKLVIVHNMLADQGIKSYRLGMTYFADMDNQEYRNAVFRGCLGSFNTTMAGRSGSTFLRQAGGADPPRRWTGGRRATSPTSRTRSSAAPAGPSARRAPWRGRPSVRRRSWCRSASSSWWTAPGTLATRGAGAG
ncbi:hypothetical protein ANANG_G00004390 [Anguilla anguilla]|uniref:Cathepsin propeptide inhibitor domain-containing protein n=1 Tax=Anguilla anguilla TaxID=7936 RepID=A0A9D3MVM2_ANGAN|nr:hypothetical protein ANANG_G00004390 [Anguilla anguilla]